MFAGGSACFEIDGTHYGNSGCTGIHESVHLRQFRGMLEVALADLWFEPALEPEPLQCGDNSCAGVLQERYDDILTAIINAAKKAEDEWVAAGESLEFEANQAQWQCSGVVATAMCVSPTNCTSACCP